MTPVAKLLYVTNVSVDGYIEDEHGSFDWTEPDDEVFAFITDLVRPVGTYLYGRRLYESMAVWETDPALAAGSELMADFAGMWRAADKPWSYPASMRPCMASSLPASQSAADPSARTVSASMRPCMASSLPASQRDAPILAASRVLLPSTLVTERSPRAARVSANALMISAAAASTDTAVVHSVNRAS